MSSTEEQVLSIEETNRLRVSLGLKPLKVEAKTAQTRERRPEESEANKAAARKDAEEIRAKLAESKERRRQEATNRRTKTLGEAEGSDEDDLAAWVEKKTGPSQLSASKQATQMPAVMRQQQRMARASACAVADLIGVMLTVMIMMLLPPTWQA